MAVIRAGQGIRGVLRLIKDAEEWMEYMDYLDHAEGLQFNHHSSPTIIDFPCLVISTRRDNGYHHFVTSLTDAAELVRVYVEEMKEG